MIIILKENTTARELSSLTEMLESHGVTPHITEGIHQTIVGLVGDTTRIDIESIYMNAPENNRYSAIFLGDPEDFSEYEIIELPFQLYIGKNIKDISVYSLTLHLSLQLRASI